MNNWVWNLWFKNDILIINLDPLYFYISENDLADWIVNLIIFLEVGTILVYAGSYESILDIIGSSNDNSSNMSTSVSLSISS